MCPIFLSQNLGRYEIAAAGPALPTLGFGHAGAAAGESPAARGMEDESSLSSSPSKRPSSVFPPTHQNTAALGSRAGRGESLKTPKSPENQCHPPSESLPKRARPEAPERPREGILRAGLRPKMPRRRGPERTRAVLTRWCRRHHARFSTPPAPRVRAGMGPARQGERGPCRCWREPRSGPVPPAQLSPEKFPGASEEPPRALPR